MWHTPEDDYFYEDDMLYYDDEYYDEDDDEEEEDDFDDDDEPLSNDIAQIDYSKQYRGYNSYEVFRMDPAPTVKAKLVSEALFRVREILDSKGAPVNASKSEVKSLDISSVRWIVLKEIRPDFIQQLIRADKNPSVKELFAQAITPKSISQVILNADRSFDLGKAFSNILYACRGSERYLRRSW
jgi:hypothetical protein